MVKYLDLNRINISTKRHLICIGKIKKQVTTYNILTLLLRQGLIKFIKKDISTYFYSIGLKYYKEKPILKKIKFDLTSGNKVFYTYYELCKKAKNKQFIFSCNKGIFFSKDIFLIRKGGIILFYYN